MTKQEYEAAKALALPYYDKAHIVLTQQERDNFEVADFGLGDWRNVGLNLVVYVNTERCCAKEMVLLPGQTCPEHVHEPFGDYPGKEETFRCRMGMVYLYVEGEPTESIRATLPQTGREYYQVFHEVILREGEQYTMSPNTRHWFQGGPEGAVISEFSTTSYDEYDVFTDPNIRRIPTIEP